MIKDILKKLKDKKDLQSEEMQHVVESIMTGDCLLYTSPSPRDRQKSRMPSSA